MTLHYPSVPVDVGTPIQPARLWQPILAVFIVPEASVQRFLIASHAGLTLRDRFQVDAPYGALSRHTADVIEAHGTDYLYEALIRSVGIQTDMGVVMD